MVIWLIYWLGWLSPTPLKIHEVKVSWDDEIPNIWTNKISVPNHQPVNSFLFQGMIMFYGLGSAVPVRGGYVSYMFTVPYSVEHILYG